MGERIVITGRAVSGSTEWSNEIEFDKAEWEAMTKEERYFAVVEDMLEMVELVIWYKEPGDE